MASIAAHRCVEDPPPLAGLRQIRWPWNTSARDAEVANVSCEHSFSASTTRNHHNGSATAGLEIEVLFSSTHTTVGWPTPWVEIVNGAAADTVEDIDMRRIRKRTYSSTSKAPQIPDGVAAASIFPIAPPASCDVDTDDTQNSFLSDAHNGGRRLRCAAVTRHW